MGKNQDTSQTWGGSMSRRRKQPIRIRQEDRQTLRRFGLDKYTKRPYYKMVARATMNALAEERKPLTLPIFIAQLSDILESFLSRDTRVARKMHDVPHDKRKELLFILSLAITQKAIAKGELWI